MELTAPAISPIVDWIAVRLAQGSVQAVLIVALVWMVCRAASVTPRVRALAWWMVSLKLVLTFVPLPSVPLPLLPAPLSASRLSTYLPSTRLAATSEGGAHEPYAAPAIAAPAAMPAQGDNASLHEFGKPFSASPGAVHDLSSSRTQTGASPVPWLAILIVSWIAIVVAQAIALLAAHRRIVEVVRRSIPVTAGQAHEVAYLATRVGLRRLPRVCVSDEVTSPQAVGIRRPVILLPNRFEERVTAGEWQMALCHELMHLRRRDLLLGWVPAISARLFFFHPLVRATASQYLLAREAACDAAAVEALDVDAHDYARMLVRLGLSRAPSGAVASGAAATASLLRRRIEMLQHVTTTGGAKRAHWLVAAAAIALFPFHLVAKSPQPRGEEMTLASATSATQPTIALDGDQAVVSGNQKPRTAPTQALRQADRASSLQNADAADTTSPVQQSAAPAPMKESPAHDRGDQTNTETRTNINTEISAEISTELGQQAAALAEQVQDAINQALEHREDLAVRYTAMHPEMQAIERRLAELQALSRAGLWEELRFAASPQNAAGGQDQAAWDAQIAKLSEQLAALSKELETLRSVAPNTKDVQYKAALKALKDQLQALEATQREARRADLRESTRRFLDQEIAHQRANVEALKAQRQAATSRQETQRLDAQLNASLASLQSLEAKRRDAERAAKELNRSVERRRGANGDALSLQASIARERANVERQKHLLDSAQRRLAEAEARLQQSEQRLKQQNQQKPQTPQELQTPQKPQNPRP